MKNHTPEYVTGIRKSLIEGRSNLHFILKAIAEYRSLPIALRVMKEVMDLKKEITGRIPVRKLVKANGRYHWNMHLPGFPSRALDEHALGEMNRISPVRSKNNRLSILFMGITKKCPLQCRHCYEWDALNQAETLTLSAMKRILKKFLDAGVSHIQLAGGEPMTRFDDLVELVKYIGSGPDSWISTCGFNLTAERAMILKKAGLSGVAVSVDHFDPDAHNDFRGNRRAWDWAINATANAREAGLITCWSVCVTREFVSRGNLLQYAAEAKRNKVTYIQVFEPMAAGRYLGKDVTLRPEELKILEDFYRELNTNKRFRDFPVIAYTGIYQRRIGCLGSGNRYVYVDTDGNIQACPFCRNAEKMQVNDHSAYELLDRISREGCAAAFHKSEQFISIPSLNQLKTAL
jgi:MoaA/NifB/PqqE/SkfB family radical SAM enzyme